MALEYGIHRPVLWKQSSPQNKQQKTTQPLFTKARKNHPDIDPQLSQRRRARVLFVEWRGITGRAGGLTPHETVVRLPFGSFGV